MRRTRLAVVGCGHLGAIHARLLAGRPDVQLVAVVDPAAEQRQRVAAMHGCHDLATPDELKGMIDAAVIAAPTSRHAAVSIPLLEAGVDLLVEKPIAADQAGAREIVAAARTFGRVVAVGHVERFNPAWPVAVEKCGRVVAVEASRLAPFTFRSLDVGAVLDIMIHDIDLVLSLQPGDLQQVDAHGVMATGGHEDAVRARLVFSSGMVANLTASRLHPTLVRHASLWGTRGLVTVDFNTKTVDSVVASTDVLSGAYEAERVPLTDRGEMKERFFSDVMTREVSVVPDANAIASEHEDFLRAVRQRSRVRVPAEAGLAALEVAHRILDAMTLIRMSGDERAATVRLPGVAGDQRPRKIA